MTEIIKTNERDERKQVGDALTSVEADITTIEGDITTIEGNITTLQGQVAALEAGVNGKPPTSLKGIPTTRATTTLDTAELEWITQTTASETAFDTWKVILQETAAEGVIEFMTVHQVANASDRDVQARLTVDGTVVWLSSTTYWAAAADNADGAILVGSYSGATSIARIGLGQVPFATSFKLDFKKTENAAGTIEMGTFCKYHLTG